MCLAYKITGDEDGADHIIISGNSALNDTDNYTLNIIIILFYENIINVKVSRAPSLKKKLILKKVQHTKKDCPGTPVLLHINHCFKHCNFYAAMKKILSNVLLI